MNIVVCVKHVLASAAVEINPLTNTVIREGSIQIINPPDRHAIEEGIRLKEKYGGTIVIISMGTLSIEDSLRKAMGNALDEAYLLSDDAFSGSDTLATSYILACGIRKIGNPDLIIMGKHAIDGETGQVGPEVAEHLNIPHVTEVRKIEKVDKKGYLYMERQFEDGYSLIKIRCPLLITVLQTINEPRRGATLKETILCKKKTVRILTLKELNANPEKVGRKGSPTQVVRIVSSSRVKKGCIYTGNTKKTVSALLSTCHMLNERKKKKMR